MTPTTANKRKMMIYGINLYDYDNIEVGREYYLDRAERDERLVTVAVHSKEAFEFMLSKKTVWLLNNHVIGREKKKINELKDELELLKKKLKARIELIFNE